MRKIFRTKNNKEYWENPWSHSAVDDEKFDSIFAFGLYHKLEDIDDLKKSSLKEIKNNYTAMF